MINKSLLATAASFALATPVLAGPSDSVSIDVAFSDLDLSTQEGLDKLERRIDSAARSICRRDRVETGSRLKSEEKKCFRRVRASVKTQVAQLVEDRQRGG